MKVLFVWHASADPLNRPFLESLLRQRELDVLALTMPRVEERQAQWRLSRPVSGENRRTGSRYRLVPGRVLLPSSLGYHLYLDLARHLREFRPELIHVVAESAMLVAVEAAWLRDRIVPGARLVLHPVQNLIVDYRWPWPPLERYVLSHVDAAVAYSPGVTRVLRHRRFRKPVYVRPFGADPAALSPRRATPVRRLLRRGLPVIGWAGRMFYGKGLHVLFRASATMRRPHQLLVVGDGPRRATEEALARQLGIAGRIVWAGTIPADRMPDYYAAMDIYTHPGVSRPPDMPDWKEQFARTLVEAMLAGKPIVASNSGEIPWVVGNGGIIVPEKNPAALAKALDRVVGSAALRAALRRRGRTRALQNFTWDAAARGLTKIWREVLAQ